MGNWTMVIEGSGVHGDDLKALLEGFIESLQETGQAIDHVSLTKSERLDLIK